MEVKRLALTSLHEGLGAKMVNFGGFLMPVQYKNGIIHEHKVVRSSVGVFDVSHMGEVVVSGENAFDFVQKITVNDVSKLVNGQVQYSAMCYENGGIVDDLLVYKMAENKFFLVINAGNRDKDISWMKQHLPKNVDFQDVGDDYTLLAVQGRNAEKTIQKLTETNLSKINYYFFVEGKIAGMESIISRTGYTGEDGFELYFQTKHSQEVWDKLFEAGKEFGIEPIGLGARDSLRMEMKMALYGNDIDQTTNPVEAGLGWITKLDKSNFIGREALLKVKEEKPKRNLVAFVVDSKRVARQHTKIFANGVEIGEVTSGNYSPSLDKNIGIGFVKSEFSKVGTMLEVEIGANFYKAEVVKPPFYKRDY
ncbi:glycine cleavage system aminomethyltransferase GcvT [bacterium]|nr:glycine cleavage system aminomethyltransferase GcvT [bacterium]